MLVRVKEKCFIGGSLRKPGQEFEFTGNTLPAFLEEVIGPAPVVDLDDEMETGNLRIKLAEYGVKVAPRTGKAKMLEMLAEVEAPKG